MEGLEDAWPRNRYFLLTTSHAKSFIFEQRMAFNLFILLLLLNNLSFI